MQTTNLIQRIQQQAMPMFGKFFIKSLRENCQVESLHQEELSLKDYVDTHQDPSYIVGFGDKNRNYYILHWSEKLFFTLHDRQLGGTRDPYIKNYSQGLSAVEKNHMKIFSTELMFVFNQFLYQHKSLELTPQIIQMPMDFLRIPPDEKVDHITFDVEATFGGQFSLIISKYLR
jgi:flagellar motor switch protein FliM